MFIVANDVLLGTTIKQAVFFGATFAQIQGVTLEGATAFIIGKNNSRSIFLSVPSYSGDIVILDVKDRSLINVLVIEIAGIRYTLGSDPATLEKGEFFWDSSNQNLIIKVC